MNLQQIQFAVAVADTKSFTRASELCFVTQPALSNAIGLLEEELGERLFVRTTRSVDLSDFGRHVLQDMREITKLKTNIIQFAAEHSQKETKTFRFGVSPLVNSDYLAQLLGRIKTRMPKVEVILHEMNAADIASAMESKAIDLGIGPTPCASQDCGSSHVYEEPLLALSKDFPQTSQSYRLDQLTEHQFVLVENNCGLAGATRQLFENNGLSLNEYPGKAISYSMLENWAELGIGSALLPASKISLNSIAKPLLDSSDTQVSISFEAVWHEGKTMRKGLSDLIQILSN